jgi:hypothetical protein
MTLLERITRLGDDASIDGSLRSQLGTIPGAIGLAVSHAPSGTHALLVVDEAGDAFLDREEQAMDRLVAVRRSFPDSAIDLVVLSTREAEGVEVPPEAVVYRYTSEA